jgi:hypothetical protein
VADEARKDGGRWVWLTPASFAKGAAFSLEHRLAVETVVEIAIDLLVVAMEKETCEKVVEVLQGSAQQSRSGCGSVAPISKCLDGLRKKGGLRSRV